MNLVLRMQRELRSTVARARPTRHLSRRKWITQIIDYGHWNENLPEQPVKKVIELKLNQIV